jgi:hypothetical protein
VGPAPELAALITTITRFFAGSRDEVARDIPPAAAAAADRILRAPNREELFALIEDAAVDRELVPRGTLSESEREGALARPSQIGAG